MTEVLLLGPSLVNSGLGTVIQYIHWKHFCTPKVTALCTLFVGCIPVLVVQM